MGVCARVARFGPLVLAAGEANEGLNEFFVCKRERSLCTLPFVFRSSASPRSAPTVKGGRRGDGPLS